MKRSEIVNLDKFNKMITQSKKSKCNLFVKLAIVLVLVASGVAIYFALKKSCDEDCYYDDDDFDDDDFDDDDFDDDDDDFDEDFDDADFDDAKIEPIE